MSEAAVVRILGQNDRALQIGREDSRSSVWIRVRRQRTEFRNFAACLLAQPAFVSDERPVNASGPRNRHFMFAKLGQLAR